MKTQSNISKLVWLCLALLLIVAPGSNAWGQTVAEPETEDHVEGSASDLANQVLLPLVQGTSDAAGSMDTDESTDEVAEVSAEEATEGMADEATEISPQVQSASLGSSVWTHVGSACAPEDDSMGRYDASAARFRHKGTNTGYIYARCNVTNPEDDGGSPRWNILEVVYLDPGSTTQVRAILYRVSNTTGGVWPVATFDSNLHPQSAAVRTDDEFFGNYTFNFDDYAYYVELRVYRSTSTYLPNITIVRLRETLF